MALFGTVGGVGLGLFLGWALVSALSGQDGEIAFTTVAAPMASVVVVLALGALVGVLTAIAAD